MHATLGDFGIGRCTTMGSIGLDRSKRANR